MCGSCRHSHHRATCFLQNHLDCILDKGTHQARQTEKFYMTTSLLSTIWEINTLLLPKLTIFKASYFASLLNVPASHANHLSPQARKNFNYMHDLII